MEHQSELFTRECNRIIKEVENTDFFLNKVQPISQFTQVVHLMRNVIEDEEQLQRIQDLQDQFFKDMASSDTKADLEKYLQEKKENIEIEEAKSPHFDRIMTALEHINE